MDVTVNGGWGSTSAGPAATLGDLGRPVAWIVVLLVGGLVYEAGRAAVHRARQRRLHTDARLVTVLAPPRVAEDGAAALWGNLAGLLRPRWRRLLTGQPHLSFEYHLTAHASTIRIWVPGPIPPGLVERAVTAAWPGTTTRTAPAGPPTTRTLNKTLNRAVVTGGTLRLARAGGLPLTDHAPGDPVTALLAAAGDLTDPPTIPPGHPGGAAGDRATDEIVVQVLARPVPTRSARARTAHGVGNGVGGVVVDAAGRTLAWLVRECLAIAVPTAVPTAGSRARTAPGTPVTGGDRRARLAGFSEDRAAALKARQATFETLVRYAATTYIRPDASSPTDPVRARAQLAHARRVVRGRAHAVAAVFASFTGHNHYRRHHHQRWPTHAISARRLSRGDLLSIAELAAIATLPTGHAPGLARAGARAVAPPPGIPTPGPDVKPLGDTTTATGPPAASGRRAGRPVGVRVADARHHLHVIGATGSGKSTLLVQLVLADIAQGRGVVVIDPKGDLITDLTTRLPASALARAVLIDPDRGGPPPNLNPLATAGSGTAGSGTAGSGTAGSSTAGSGTATSAAAASPAARALAVENLVAICRRVFAAYWGPRTDDLMRAACLTLAAQPGPRSLADLPALLTHPDVRARALRAVTDPVLRGFWTGYEQLSEPARAATIAPLMNKIRALLLRPYPRALLTGLPPATGAAHQTARQPSPPVNLGRVLDGGILLARIPKGSLGDEATRLVGSIIVAHTWTAATARTRLPQDRRRDAALVIDECHNFLNLPHSIDDLLAEARGLRLSVTLAHQNLAQLPRDLRAGIAANARNKIFFTVAPDDARDLARHTAPHLDEHDLAHLDAFHAAARLVDHGADTPAFTLQTRALPPPRPRPTS